MLTITVQRVQHMWSKNIIAIVFSNSKIC